MARYEFNNTDDIIDVRDVIARFEELDDSISTDTPHGDPARIERERLDDLLADLKGNGGDEQWLGDWYPITLIRDSYFEQAMDEMLEDCCELPKDLPCYLSITVDYKALQMDYSSIELNGVTYWYR